MSLRRPNGFISAGFNPLEVPNAPTIGTATSAGPTAVSVTFTAPSNVGGSAITGYVATARKTSDGTTISGTGSSSPVTISGLTTGTAYTVTVAAVNSFGLGLSSAASNSVTPVAYYLYSWGYNDGILGLNNTAQQSSPTQVGALTSWSQISVSYHSLAVKLDNTLWSWGRNGYGQLGLNDRYNTRSSPVQVGALTTWSKVATANNNSLAIKTDGTMWAWGKNANGSLGLGNTTYYSSPKQVGALTAWSKVSAGNNFCAAIKTDGTMWSWGLNDGGQLGIGNTYTRNSPVQVGALTTWSEVSCGQRSCLALKTDGTLWSWGYRFNGQGNLGLGDNISRSSPVQIGALTTWSQISTGSYHSLATKTDGALWAWGSAAQGQLGGNNTSPNRYSPVQIGALTGWLKPSAGKQNSLCVKTDGTLWVWGKGQNGRLGLNSTTYFSSPVQVGSDTTWVSAIQPQTSLSALAIKTS